MEIATNVSYEYIIFSASVLKHKIDRNAPALERMLANDNDEENTAIIHYELWKMTGRHEHSEIAKEVYCRLYEKIPKSQFKKRIEEMS